MKAIRIHKYGGPEVLQYEDAPRPKVAAATDVLIRVHAAGVNPTDWKVREGYLKDFLQNSRSFLGGTFWCCGTSRAWCVSI
jgi:NADPH:quinone reductase-like Zn-dependent oxidoreductase